MNFFLLKFFFNNFFYFLKKESQILKTEITKNDLLKQALQQSMSLPPQIMDPPIVTINNDHREEIKKISRDLLKEKINKLGMMVEEFIKYRENKKKNVSIQKFQTEFFDKKNNKNSTNGKAKIGKQKKFLDINDNYFVGDDELYEFYGAIPHFMSYN